MRSQNFPMAPPCMLGSQGFPSQAGWRATGGSGAGNVFELTLLKGHSVCTVGGRQWRQGGKSGASTVGKREGLPACGRS